MVGFQEFVTVEGVSMSIESSRTGEVRPRESADPRSALAQERYFTARPEPLETWLWEAEVPAGAERVFWLHWREGARSGDWCSQISISAVASHCRVDQSTVTRAYQLLAGLGVLRRTDPGRDPKNPFCQATAVTEVLIPRVLLGRLHTLPKRQRAKPRVAERPCPAPIVVSEAPKPDPAASVRVPMRERLRQLAALTSSFSEAEKERWQVANHQHLATIAFDSDTRVPAAIQAQALAFLASISMRVTPPPAPNNAPPAAKAAGPRRVSVFDLARIRRSLQSLSGENDVAELCRQILWATEEGALSKHSPALAINIALKKVREGLWTRPNRMPPNWVRQIAKPAGLEPRSHA
jgi:hypothetical protein